MDPLEFRSVTDLEEITELSDDDSLLLVSNGTAKQIKKTNAKLGGGATTIYSVDESSGQSASVSPAAEAGPTHLNLLDGDGNAVTAQQVYDAFMSGRVLVVFDADAIGEMTSVRDITGTTGQVVDFIALIGNTEYVIGEAGE